MPTHAHTGGPGGSGGSYRPILRGLPRPTWLLVGGSGVGASADTFRQIRVRWSPTRCFCQPRHLRTSATRIWSALVRAILARGPVMPPPGGCSRWLRTSLTVVSVAPSRKSAMGRSHGSSTRRFSCSTWAALMFPGRRATRIRRLASRGGLGPQLVASLGQAGNVDGAASRHQKRRPPVKSFMYWSSLTVPASTMERGKS